jgi:sugar phosphate isomerase/epimerase
MPRVKVGLSTLFCLGEPFSSMTGHLRKTDVSYVEIVDDGLHALDLKRVKILKKMGRSQDFEYTVHAPFADINIASPSNILRKAMLKRLEKSIIHASELNCQVWVLHPGLKTGLSSFYPGEDWKQNLESIRNLIYFAKGRNVEVAIENCPEPYPFLLTKVNDLSRFYRELSKDLGLVFDIGHANLNCQIQEILVRFSSKIVHIHAHDNRGKNDEHLGIGHGSINWKSVVDQIKKIKYKRIVVVESITNVEESILTLKRLFI